ncbi:hypothetical protein LAV84_29165 [Rhizobium sp. VS19-DR104.2]|uniref:hypothetical protein n=1 Tax=unclassified Rhizobium TaxID=2613769 RepID=UPI001C5BBD42|nr:MULTISPECIES: hypothetical protein [unclassified Rhizobium]MBZ5821308.1 hypothetical protein [Rhizobium sp. VS19-DR183]MBZ5763555.1 hypothetical protein [Rhizobium sp. VS19-DR96]MBZ5769478.1 hypothetical protein [Rhizobium sp. VS19-DR129.2]MBZ5788149.1 hypothetical protein [Rhizobium sp. VS19-DR121]MBZ5805604.1 hypothetical protein [Rhizobium sp. VS19-DR181]
MCGGSYSYITVEADPGQELEVINGYSLAGDEPSRKSVLASVIGGAADEFPSNLKDAIDILTKTYPPEKTVVRLVDRVDPEAGSSDLKVQETGQNRKVMDEWKSILNNMSPPQRAMLVAWNRVERDTVLDRITKLPYLPNVAATYLNANISCIKRQEMRWREGVQMGIWERIIFWIWMLVMQLGVIVPDTVSVFLGAVIAVFRSGPIRLQNQLMAIAILDFPWADERLARFIILQRFLGILPTILFGISALADSGFRRTAFKGVSNISWKAVICILWQVLMHNWKNLYDLYYSKRLRALRLSSLEKSEIVECQVSLSRSNALIYAEFEIYQLGNRFGAQTSYYKQDHEDVAKGLHWIAHTETKEAVQRNFAGKFSILIAVIAIGSMICTSAFPVDPYAGLVAIAYFGPLTIRTAVDVWGPSQSLEDLLRLFTITAGPTFPSTLLMVVNLIYWIITREALFVGFSNIKFAITFAVLVYLSLYPKLWGEGFLYVGLACQKYGSRITGKSSGKNNVIP